MSQSRRFRPIDGWVWTVLAVGILLMAGGYDACRADGPGDASSNRQGFPSGQRLRDLLSPGRPPVPRQSRTPIRRDLGPLFWGQEGGSATRNPFFPPRPSKPPSTPASASPSSGLDAAKGQTIPVVDHTRSPREIRWTTVAGSSSLGLIEYRFSHQPLVVGGRVLLTSTRGQVLCLDAANGSILWHARLPESVWASGVADNHAYYMVSGSPFVTAPHMMGYAQTRHIRRGEGPGHLYALSLLSGKILWTAEVPGPAIGSPVLEGGKIWVATGNGRLLGFSAKAKKKIIDMPLFSSSGWSSPLFVHHWLWVSLEGPTKLVALWPDKKRTVWSLTSEPAERLVLFTPTPAFGASKLVTLLLSVHKGRPVEQLAIASPVTGHLFHLVPFAHKGETVAVEPPVPPDLPPFARVFEGMAGPVVARKTAVVASPILGRAMAVDIPSGRVFWSIPLPSPAVGPGTVAGLAYVLPLQDRVLLIDLSSGHILTSLPVTGEPVPGSPPVVDTTLYLAEKNGQVNAIPLAPYRALIFPAPPGPAGTQAGGKRGMTG